jgi:hypothetical protein
MRAAVYARVSTTRQAPAQTIEQQLDRLRAVVVEHGWTLSSPARMPSSCGPHPGPEWVRVSQLRDVVWVFSPPDPAPVLAGVKVVRPAGRSTLTPAAAGGPSHPREASQ